MDTVGEPAERHVHNKGPESSHYHHHAEDIPVDLVDPHRAALDLNPDHAEVPSLSTMLAVVVSLLNLA